MQKINKKHLDMMFFELARQTKEHRREQIIVCTPCLLLSFFLSLSRSLLLSVFTYVHIKHTINTSNVCAGYILKNMMNSTCCNNGQEKFFFVFFFFDKLIHSSNKYERQQKKTKTTTYVLIRCNSCSSSSFCVECRRSNC